MMSRPERTAVIQKASFPILFIAGQHDIAVTITDSLKQSHLANATHFHILENSGHMGMIEEKEKTIELLLGYLNAIEKQ